MNFNKNRFFAADKQAEQYLQQVEGQ